jgi:hypothetical protein
MSEGKVKFEVAAGKIEWVGEDVDRNYKYIDTFDTLEEAEAALETCKGYPFAEIVYIAANGNRYLMDPL